MLIDHLANINKISKFCLIVIIQVYKTVVQRKDLTNKEQWEKAACFYCVDPNDKDIADASKLILIAKCLFEGNRMFHDFFLPSDKAVELHSVSPTNQVILTEFMCQKKNSFIVVGDKENIRFKHLIHTTKQAYKLVTGQYMKKQVPVQKALRNVWKMLLLSLIHI